MKKLISTIALAAGLLAIVSCGSSGGKGSSSKAPLAGLEQYTIAYFDEIYAHMDDPKYDQSEALNKMKESIEKHLSATVGKKMQTICDPAVGKVETPFTVSEVSGNVGRSSAVPYALLSSEITTDASVLGYICRDKDGLPVYAGKAPVSDGKISVTIRFSHEGAKEWCIASDKTLSSMTSIELLSENDFNSHILNCKGASYNPKGFGDVKLFGKASAVPASMAGIYDKTEVKTSVEEGPEEDFEITELIFSSNGTQVACAGFADDEIYSIEVTTPEIFYLPDVHKYDGNIPLHCKSEAVLLLQAAGGRGTFTDVNYIDVPAVKIGMAWFTGMKLKDENPRREFYAADIAEGSRAEKFVLRRSY